MKSEVLIAILTKLLEDKVSKIQLMPGPRGQRGPHGLNGRDGRDGRDGKDFDFQENEDRIKKLCEIVALKFEDFTDEQIRKITGPKGDAGKDGKDFVYDEHELKFKQLAEESAIKFDDLNAEQIEKVRGPRGRDGNDGKDFDFTEHQESISELVEKFSLKFEDFTPEQIEKLRGQKGDRGEQGRAGKDFNYEEHELKFKQLAEETSIKFEDFTPEQIEKLRGQKGDRGESGRAGKDFIFEEHQEVISELVEKFSLTFDDLNAEQIEKIRGPRGRDGLNGRDFNFSENKEAISDLVEKHIPKFDDFNAEQIEKIRGPRGRDGRDGKDGRDFDFGEQRNDIENILRSTVHGMYETLRLKFSDLSADDIEQLRGPRGRDGRDGRDFKFEDHREFFESLRLKFSDLTKEEKDTLKLHFADLTDEEKSKLKLRFEDLTENDRALIRGPRGGRGQKGLPGRDGKDGKTIRGLPGLPGRDGKDGIGISGSDGQDGKDAPYIVDIVVEERGKGTIEFIFYLSDNTFIRTNGVDLPAPSQMRFISAPGGGSPSTSTPSSSASVSDEAYDATAWDGETDVAPSKNAVRDIIESIIAGGGGSVSSVNGQTGIVVLDKTDIGLGNVDNTSDVNKPVSTAQQTAIDAKVDDTAYDATTWNADTTHSPSKNSVRDILETIISSISSLSSTISGIGSSLVSLASTVSGLVVDSIADSDTTHAPSRNAVFDALAGKSNTGHTHVSTDVTDFDAAAKAAVVNDTAYDATTWNGDVDHAPSKNAVRDIIESVIGMIGGGSSIDDTAYDATTWNSDTTHAPSKNAVRDIIETILSSISSLVSTVSGLVIDSIADSDTTHAPSRNAVFDALALKADLASPNLTGTPLAPTASPGTNNTQIATTAYADEKVIDSIADSDTTHAPSRNAVFDALALKAPLASPALTGNPTAPTQSAHDNSTKLSTTAYADALVDDTAYDATSWNGVGFIAASKNAVRDIIESILSSISTLSSTVSGLVIDSIADSDTTHAPSRNSVFDALALKASTTHKTTHEADGSDPLNFTKVLGVNTVFVDAANYPLIQDAIDYAETLPAANRFADVLNQKIPGVCILIPAGYFDEDVVIRKNISLVGAGRSATQIKSITSRPQLPYTFTANDLNGSAVISNISINAETFLSQLQRITGASIGARDIATVDSPTQVTLTAPEFSGSHVGEVFTVQPVTQSQVLIGLSCPLIVVTNETAAGSGIYLQHLAGFSDYAFTIAGCLGEILSISNPILGIAISHSEFLQATTLLNICGASEIANSVLQAVNLQADDTNPGYLALVAPVYFDQCSFTTGLTVEKLAGATDPTGAAYNCSIGTFSKTIAGPFPVNGNAFVPTTPGDWSPAPSTSHEALDQLAARPVTAPDDTAYDATTWNGDTTHAPSKNAVRDILETIISAATSLASTVSGLVIDSIADSDTTHAPSRNAVFDALALKANLASPALTGNPTAPTQSAHDNSTKIASTAYVDGVVDDTAYDATSWNGVGFIAASKNAVRDIIETILASISSLSSTVSGLVIDSIADSDTTHAPSRNAVFDALALKAPLASPTLTGVPLAPTAGAGTNNTQIATTAYADGLISDTAYDATTWNGVGGIGPSKNAVRDKIDSMDTTIAGLVVDSIADSDTTHAPSRNAVFDALALKANLASPALTGTPTAPTATPGTNNTQIATTAYADAAAGATVVDSIADSDTTHAPSRNAVFDALALKEASITAGTNLQYWRGDKTFQTLNTAAVPELTNLYYTDARARAAVSATLPLTYNSSTGVFTLPMSQTEVDFGSTPVTQMKFTVTDANILSTHHIIAAVAYEAPTGKTVDEIEMDQLHVVAGPNGNGSMFLIVTSLSGPVRDKFKINYRFG